MSLLLIEGFDDLSNLSRRYSVLNSPTLNESTYRTGRQSIYCPSSTNGIVLPFLTTYTTVYIGFGIYINAFSLSVSDSSCCLRMYNATGIQCGIGITPAGKIVVFRSSTSLGESTQSLIINNWYYLEAKITVSNSISANDFIVRVNDSEWLNLGAGTDTQGQATSGITYLYLTGNGASGGIYYDDLYILDTNGSINNTFLGDVKVATLYPNGNGNSNDFDGSDGNQIDNYLLVDEIEDNSDTDYVESLTVSEKDLYAFGNMPETPDTIHGILCRAEIKKSSSGSRTGKIICRRSSTDYESSAFSPGISYLAYEDLRETDPSTSLKWTESGINAAEFGIKVES